MASTPAGSTRVLFGPFRLDVASGVLEKRGIRVRLAKQPSEILGILVNRPGGVVSREELRKQLWGSDTIVDFEHGLNVAINKLRQALDDSAERPRYIETLPGRGYRFLATVQPEEPVDYSSELPAAPQTIPTARGWVLPVAICIGTAFGVMATMALLLTRRATEVPKATVVKFAISAPQGFAFEPAAFRQGFSISPDGSRLAFTAMGEDGTHRLWIRNLSELDSHELAAARGLHTVFWAPPGESLYFGVGRSLRRIAGDGSGSYQIVSDLSRRVPAAGTWLPPEHLLLSSRQSTFLLPADGRKANALSQTYLWPQALPDKQHLLYLAYDEKLGRFRLRAARFGQPASGRDILETDSRVTFVRSEKSDTIGYLIYVRAGSLLAQPFDSGQLQLKGAATPIAEEVYFFQPTGAADFSVSENGTLVYQSLARRSRIVWLDRSGRELEQVATGSFSVKYVRASSDGRKVAAVISNADKGSTEVWIFDKASKVNRLVVSGPGVIDTPIWSSDSKRLLYARALGSGPKLYSVGMTDNDSEQVLPSAEFQLATDWSRDGRYVLYNTENVIDGDIGVVDLTSKRAMPILNTTFHEAGAVFSPDSRWVGFIANDSGRSEAYVEAFRSGDTPGLIGERRRVSEQGALCVRWRRDGKELIYLGTDGILYSVRVKGPDLEFGRPVRLFRIPIAWRAVLPTTFAFDVSEDGSRFLVAITDESARSNLVVVENWEALIRSR